MTSASALPAVASSACGAPATGALPPAVLRYGRDVALPKLYTLRAGPLMMQLEEGDLRYIRLGEQEVLRRVYSAVRDPLWMTVLPRLSDVKIEASEASFRVSFLAEHIEKEIDFAWRGEITGDAQGKVVYRMRGEARSTFQRARIGFCVLHPMQCAGARCRVKQADGTEASGTFPVTIKPDCPFGELVELDHEVRPGVWARLRFSGDLFEMEDQRNWTDASYKTFCTPLRIPYPVLIEKGTVIEQTVELTIEGDAASLRSQSAPVRATAFEIDTRKLAGRLPSIGLGASSLPGTLAGPSVERLRALNLAHLRIDINLAKGDYASALGTACHDAEAMRVPLELAVFVSDRAHEELRKLGAQLAELRPSIARVLVFGNARMSSGAKAIAAARSLLGEFAGNAPLVAGTHVYFTELNRERPPLEQLDGVCYSINPQVHAFDNRSLVENLAAQQATLESARAFCGDKPLYVTPITLRPRFNQRLGAPLPAVPGELPFEVDERQMSLFGAAWTVGSLRYVATGGAAGATYYETVGWRGVLESENGSALPKLFRSWPGAAFPLYHVLADVGEMPAASLAASQTTDPLVVDGLCLTKDGRSRTLLANMTDEQQQVIVRGLPAAVDLRYLDETNVTEAMQAPEAYRRAACARSQSRDGQLSVSLRPYAVLRIDGA